MKKFLPKAAPTFNTKALALPGLVLFSAVYVFGTACLLNCKYLINDNALILEYAKRGLPIPYSGMLFLKLLHLAYSTTPDMPWYGLSLYALHVVCVFLWLWFFSRVIRPWWLACIMVLGFLGYYLVFLIYLDYTSTAVMLCSTSLTWAFLEVMERRPGYLRFLGPGIVFLMGMQVRPQVPLGALAYVLPIALLVAMWCLHGRHFRFEARRLVLISLVFFAPLATGLATDTAYNQYALTPKQAQFDAFNSLRGKLQNDITRPRKQEMMRDKALLASIHWTFIDAYHFFNWNFLDERIDTVAALQAMLDRAPPPNVSFREFSNAMVERLAPNPVLLLILCSIPFSLLILYRRRWLGMAALLAPVYCIALSSYMYLFFVYGDRTETPFVTGFGFCSLLISGAIAARDGDGKSRALLPATLIGALLICASSYWVLRPNIGSQEKQIEAAVETRQELEVLNRDFSGKIILMKPTGSLALQKLDPLETYTVGFQPIYLGWNTFSPLFYDQIGKLGVEHGYQLVDALIANPDAYELGTQQWCYTLLDYASNRSKRRIDVTEVRKFPDGTSLFRFVESKQ